MAKKKINKSPKVKGAKVVVLDKELDYTIEYRKGTKWNQNSETMYRYMSCKKCGQYTVTGEESVSVTCHQCVSEMVEPPQFTSRRQSSGRPAGWHFMSEFVDTDGNVYHRGEEQPKLKGKLKPTVIEKKNKISKSEKNSMIRNANEQVFKLKKELKKSTLKKDIKRLSREIAKLTKIGRGKIPRSQRFK
tara:strand:+ start:12082 stop:12648 length:567 start_codon:yes stop_codon:yes gene_type:complete